MGQAQGFEDIRDAYAQIAGMQEYALANMKAWQRNLRPGDFVVQEVNAGGESYVNYIVVLEDDGDMHESVFTGSIDNAIFPGYEQVEAIYRNTLHGRLTPDEYAQCGYAGWPSTLVDMLFTLYGAGDGRNNLLAWLYQPDGTPVLSDTGERVAAYMQLDDMQPHYVVPEAHVVPYVMQKWVAVAGETFRWHEEIGNKAQEA